MAECFLAACSVSVMVVSSLGSSILPRSACRIRTSASNRVETTLLVRCSARCPFLSIQAQIRSLLSRRPQAVDENTETIRGVRPFSRPFEKNLQSGSSSQFAIARVCAPFSDAKRPLRRSLLRARYVRRSKSITSAKVCACLRWRERRQSVRFGQARHWGSLGACRCADLEQYRTDNQNCIPDNLPVLV
jgi:hypothetical protein